MAVTTFIIKETLICISSWLIFLVVAAPLAPLFLLLLVHKSCVNLIVKILHPKWTPLDGLDVGCAVSMNAYKNKVLPNIGAAVLCEGDVNIDELRNEFQTKILDSRSEEDDNGVLRPVNYERLKKIPKPCLGYLYWSEVPSSIKLEKFLYEKTLDSSSVTTTEFISQWIHEPYRNEDGPFWEVCVCKGSLEHPGKTLILMKMLHCLGDGFSVARIFAKLGGFALPSGTAPKTLTTFKLKVMEFIIVPRLLFHYFTSTLIGSDILSRKEKCCSAFVSVVPLRLNSVKTVRRQLDCRFNDIFLGLIGTSVRRFLLASGEKDIPEYIPVVTPVPLPRSFSDPMKNRMSTSIYQVPVEKSGSRAGADIRGSIRRIAAQSKSFYLGRALPAVLSYFSGIPALIPTCLLRPPEGNPKACTAFTSLVPLNSFKIANCLVTKTFALAGLQLRQAGILAAAQVYNDEVNVSLMGNTGIFPSQENFNEFAAYFIEEFRKLEEAVARSKDF